jgi:hypothetical protein
LWDATDKELVTLCKDCHEKVHDSATRPTLLGDRTLICEHSYTKCKVSGDRIVPQSLYNELILKGYDGRPYTQQIIEWLIKEHWIYAHAEIYAICEKYADGRERDRASGFKYIGAVDEIRGCCKSYTEQFEDYGDAEIRAIEYSLGFW